MSSKTILISRSVFRCGRKKICPWKTFLEARNNCNSYYTEQWTETIVAVLGCQKQWSNLDNQVSENSV